MGGTARVAEERQRHQEGRILRLSAKLLKGQLLL
jgi:hypothetical protein